MDRLACVDVAGLGVQLLARRPGWRQVPVAWVERESANGRVLQVNARAERLGVRTGMRYARALGLAPKLRAAPVTAAELAAAQAELAALLQDFAPEVESDTETPGRYWLNVAGLRRLYRSPADWAGQLRARLRAAGYTAGVVVGFTRFATAALAPGTAAVRVLQTPAEERRALAQVPLRQVIQEPKLRDTLAKLGIARLGDWQRLPAAGKRERFGADPLAAARQRRFRPDPLPQPRRRHHLFAEAVTDHRVLLAVLEHLLDSLLEQLAAADEQATALTLDLELEDGRRETLRLEPATPTRDAAQLLRLAELRLAATQLPRPVQDLAVSAGVTAAVDEQLALFALRDLSAANTVLAELRARYGPDAVQCARLLADWLPGRDFAWEPLRRLQAPAGDLPRRPRLIRRLLAEPRPLPGSAPDRLPLRDVRRSYGPFHFDGAWWEQGYDQDHYLVDCGAHELAWICYDRRAAAWLLLGHVD